MKQNKTITMKELPTGEKPYEKCARFGPQALSDAELLSVILRTGSEGISALDMSRSILSLTQKGGLAGLCRVSEAELSSVYGVGRVKSMQVLCIAELSRRIAQAGIGAEEDIDFSAPGIAGTYFMEEMRHRSREAVLMLCLNSKGRLIRKAYISEGTVDMALISPREVYLTALAHGAVSIVLLHNHPSGDPTPSALDIRCTRLIKKAGDLLGIPLLDHIVIGDRTMVSLRSRCGEEIFQS